MTTPAVRDALALHKLALMKHRRRERERLAKAAYLPAGCVTFPAAQAGRRAMLAFLGADDDLIADMTGPLPPERH